MLMKWLRVFPQVISGWELATLERPILWLKGWGFEPQVSQTSRERRGIEVQLDGQMIQSVTLFNKTPIKTPALQIWVGSLAGDTHWSARRMRHRILSDLALWVSSFDWFWFVSFCSNTTMRISIVIPLVLWVILANYWTQEDSGNLWIYIQVFGNTGGLGPSKLMADVWHEGSLRRTMPLTYELVNQFTPGS